MVHQEFGLLPWDQDILVDVEPVGIEFGVMSKVSERNALDEFGLKIPLGSSAYIIGGMTERELGMVSKLEDIPDFQ